MGAVQRTMIEENIFILFYFCITVVHALVTITVLKHIGQKQLMKEGFILASSFGAESPSWQGCVAAGSRQGNRMRKPSSARLHSKYKVDRTN